MTAFLDPDGAANPEAPKEQNHLVPGPAPYRLKVVPDAKVSDTRELRAKLDRLALADPDYWSFRGNAKRDHGHGLMQYPAMMVPQMVRVLLREICHTELDVRRVGDPFVGSGTVLTEAMLRGLDFAGRDINPLAMLLCQVKAGPFFPEALAERSDELLARIASDRREQLEANFDGIDKWFGHAAQVALSRIRRGVRGESSTWARRFFWVAVAETARLCSNSRTSTFKLHVRTKADLAAREVDTEAIFARALRENLVRFASLGEALRQRGLLKRGHYSRTVNLRAGDARAPWGFGQEEEPCEVIVTSPPYGDNVTTVPYGQYSYLPLQWVDLEDVGFDVDCLGTTHEIDRRSLGGSRRVNREAVTALRERSASLAGALDLLADEPADRCQRVVAFVRDLDACLPHVLRMLRPNGLMVWVLGNRRVGGRPVPLDSILGELLQESGATLVADVRRRILSKRMATRNNIAATMANETILVFRRGASDGRTG